jgi:TldD protein
MNLSRRRFLKAGTSLAALSLAARVDLADARGLLTDPLLDEVIQRALAAAKKAGATYADVRLHRRRAESVRTREDHVVGVSSDDSYGVGIRVIAGGAWGFAASSRVEPKEAVRVAELAVEIAKANGRVMKRPISLAPVPAHVDVWQTPMTRDPFRIPLADKAELLLALNAEAMKVKGVRFATSSCHAVHEWKLFASSEGAYLEQSITRLAPGFEVTAVDAASGEFVTREHELPPAQAGWEYVEGSTLLADARRIGEEALEKLKAPSVEAGIKDVILAPSNLWLTLHESIGHPTELDRAFGDEANFAGTSFATPDQLGKLRYAAPGVTVYADKTTERGLATCGYDDDGVKTQRWNLIQEGVLVGYQTTREQAGWIGEGASRGTCYAQDFKSFPFQRMPNVSLAPGAQERSLNDLISATEDGILVAGRGSWSIDHQRYNFQFSGQTFHEVKRGKRTRMLRDVAYQSNSVEFWRKCDLLGGPSSWELHGSFSDGKGEPSQLNAVSHGCPPARFRQINVLNTNTKKKAVWTCSTPIRRARCCRGSSLRPGSWRPAPRSRSSWPRSATPTPGTRAARSPPPATSTTPL